MELNNITVFILGSILGALTVICILWFMQDKLRSILKDFSFFGAVIKSDIAEAKKDLKLYQNGIEVGLLYKGAKLEQTLHVDKINHYTLNLIFEPYSYTDAEEILREEKNIKDFSVTEIVYLGDKKNN